MHDTLSQYFQEVSWKTLSAVETDMTVSHQHEFNGVAGLRAMFGTERKDISSRFLYLADENEVSSIEGTLTWYDAREKHPNRSEFRLYYPHNPVMDQAEEGDLLVIAQRSDDDEYKVAVIIAKQGSTYEQQLNWLFGLDRDSKNFQVKPISDESDRQLGLASQWILEELGINVHQHNENDIEILLKHFGYEFPQTRALSAYARQSLDILSTDDPDVALVAWMEREEALFRAIEGYKVKDQIERGFTDVDDFLKFSLSVHNRRKSRAGYALENHLEQIFHDHRLSFDRGKITENKSKPDFLFPGVSQYHDQSFAPALLTMLGVKSTCKDRWRQVLSEAVKIEHKHLLTLETGISEAQTAEMQDKNVQLIVPLAFHETYRPRQQEWLMSVKDFIVHVAHNESQFVV